jgi:hypothetical protein
MRPASYPLAPNLFHPMLVSDAPSWYELGTVGITYSDSEHGDHDGVRKQCLEGDAHLDC